MRWMAVVGTLAFGLVAGCADDDHDFSTPVIDQIRAHGLVCYGGTGGQQVFLKIPAGQYGATLQSHAADLPLSPLADSPEAVWLPPSGPIFTLTADILVNAKNTGAEDRAIIFISGDRVKWGYSGDGVAITTPCSIPTE